MNKDFVENMENGPRNWFSITAVDGMVGSAAATVGYAAFGPVGLVAGAPLVGNIAKNCFSRMLADLEVIETRKGFVAVELTATAALMTITALAVAILTPFGITYSLCAAAIVGIPMLLDTAYAQYVVETPERPVAKEEDTCFQQEPVGCVYAGRTYFRESDAWKAFSLNNEGIHYFNDHWYAKGFESPTLSIAGNVSNLVNTPCFYEGAYYYGGEKFTDIRNAYVKWSWCNRGKIVAFEGKWVKDGMVYPTADEADSPDLKRRPTDCYYFGTEYRNLDEAMLEFSKKNEGVFEVTKGFVCRGELRRNRAYFETQTMEMEPFFEPEKGWCWNNRLFAKQHDAWILFAKENSGEFICGGYIYSHGLFWKEETECGDDRNRAARLLYDTCQKYSISSEMELWCLVDEMFLDDDQAIKALLGKLKVIHNGIPTYQDALYKKYKI